MTETETTSTDRPTPTHAPEPSRHQLAVTVWLAVLPTLTGLQLVLGDLLARLPQYARPPVMATLAVPIVVYGLMPRLLQLRTRLAGNDRKVAVA
jgi:antibiotic biosynthesis monooxygenase (ABM) superfamily enzyme